MIFVNMSTGIYPQTWFCWCWPFVWWCGPRYFFSNPAEWASHRFYKKIRTEQTTEDGRKKLTNTNSEQHLSILCVFVMANVRTPIQLQKKLTHLVIVFIAVCLRSYHHITLRLPWIHVLEPTDQLRVLGLNYLASCPMLWMSGSLL